MLLASFVWLLQGRKQDKRQKDDDNDIMIDASMIGGYWILAKKTVNKHKQYEHKYIVFLSLVQLGLISRGGSGKEQKLSGGR